MSEENQAVSAEQKGISNIMDVVVAVAADLSAAVEVLKDKKFTIFDIPTLVKTFPANQAAIVGAGEIPAEFADLSKEEALVLVGAMWNVIQKALELFPKAV